MQRLAAAAPRIGVLTYGVFCFLLATILLVAGQPGSAEMFSAAASAWAAARAMSTGR
ncbi:hypothetical protein ACFWNR_18350 [Streptomyces virginiae]|uniref:hypothetical protein n=1 Tax=Streptomyces virginiae TaxID=1961 RepID=UPI00365DFE90